MKKYSLFALTGVLVLVSLTYIKADDKKLEHPVIKPMPDSVLNERFSKTDEFSSLKLRVKESGKTTSIEVSGFSWKLRYYFLDENGEKVKGISRGAIIGNYLSAALEKGGKELSRGGNYLQFSVPRKDGGTSWARVNVAYSDYTLEIIDEKPLVAVLSFGAEELKKALDADGRVAVYGINFAVDKSDLQVGAEKVIAEFVKLMGMYPDLKLEIQGHTDNTGSAAHNLDLSNRRADAVKKYMLLFGIDGTRLVAKGYGLTQPIESNDTEEGRAKNRRVELVKIQ